MKKVRLLCFWIGIIITSIGVIMSIANDNGLIINLVYIMLLIGVFLVCRRVKKLHYMGLPIVLVALFVTFGVRAVYNVVAFWRFSQPVIVHKGYLLIMILSKVPCGFIFVGMLFMLPYLFLDYKK